MNDDHLVDDAMLARVQARARNWRRMAIGALVGFTAAAVLILSIGALYPGLLDPDERILRTLMLFAGAMVGGHWMRIRV